MGLEFDYYLDFQLKITHANQYEHHCKATKHSCQTWLLETKGKCFLKLLPYAQQAQKKATLTSRRDLISIFSRSWPIYVEWQILVWFMFRNIYYFSRLVCLIQVWIRGNISYEKEQSDLFSIPYSVFHEYMLNQIFYIF